MAGVASTRGGGALGAGLVNVAQLVNDAVQTRLSDAFNAFVSGGVELVDAVVDRVAKITATYTDASSPSEEEKGGSAAPSELLMNKRAFDLVTTLRRERPDAYAGLLQLADRVASASASPLAALALDQEVRQRFEQLLPLTGQTTAPAASSAR